MDQVQTTSGYGGNVMGAIVKEHKELLVLREKCEAQHRELGEWTRRALKAETLQHDAEVKLRKSQKGTLLDEVDEDVLFRAMAEITFKRHGIQGGRTIKIRSRGRDASVVHGDEGKPLLKKAIRVAREWLNR
jgi:hypothetical protein